MLKYFSTLFALFFNDYKQNNFFYIKYTNRLFQAHQSFYCLIVSIKLLLELFCIMLGKEILRDSILEVL